MTIVPNSTITIAGIDYVVLTAKPYTYKGDSRTEYTLRRPRGQRTYYVVQYGNGVLSEVV